jgi:hypothetical protein
MSASIGATGTKLPVFSGEPPDGRSSDVARTLAIDKDPGEIDMLRSTTSRPVVSMSAVARAASLANCSGPLAADQSAAADPDRGIVDSLSSAADIILLLDAYYLSKDEDLLLQRVEKTLIGHCMDAAESASFGYHGSANDVVARENEVQAEAKQEQLTRAARLAAEK